MARAYSQDLRERVLEAAAKGMSARQAAERFGGGHHHCLGAPVAAERRDPPDGRAHLRAPKLDAYRGYLLGLAEVTGDITLEVMQARLREEKHVAAGIGTL